MSLKSKHNHLCKGMTYAEMYIQQIVDWQLIYQPHLLEVCYACFGNVPEFLQGRWSHAIST